MIEIALKVKMNFGMLLNRHSTLGLFLTHPLVDVASLVSALALFIPNARFRMLLYSEDHM